MEKGATGGAVDDFHPGIHPVMSAENSLVTMSKMFESVMQLQVERDKRQERETAKQEQKFSVLTHQVTQLKLDLEATRSGQQPLQTRGVPSGEPTLQRLGDSDDIEHFLTTFERLAVVYNWPKREWGVSLIPLLAGRARSVCFHELCR